MVLPRIIEGTSYWSGVSSVVVHTRTTTLECISCPHALAYTTRTHDIRVWCMQTFRTLIVRLVRNTSRTEGGRVWGCEVRVGVTGAGRSHLQMHRVKPSRNECVVSQKARSWFLTRDRAFHMGWNLDWKGRSLLWRVTNNKLDLVSFTSRLRFRGKLPWYFKEQKNLMTTKFHDTNLSGGKSSIIFAFFLSVSVRHDPDKEHAHFLIHKQTHNTFMAPI
jgi:hypothetical protein